MTNTTDISKDTVEVPILWLEKLIELGEKTDVPIHATAMGVARADKTRLSHLKGYIESASSLLSNTTGAKAGVIDETMQG